MEDSSCSSSSSDSSSMRKGDRVVMCMVANHKPVSRSREFDPRSFLQYGGHRQGDKPDSNSGGASFMRGSGFDYSALLN